VRRAHAAAWGRQALLAACALPAAIAGCATRGAPSWVDVEGVAPSRPPAAHPSTRAERTGYRETSHYADVVGFLDSLKTLGAPLAFGSIGRTVEGREIPYVVASRPRVTTPAEARASGRPIVYVQANIHAGEVEGKEALLALLRDLTFAAGPNVLDSIVLVAVPIYNADGNEKWGLQERQRTEQNGPELVGQRPNAQGLDLNRDYVKVEAPETRASLAMFEAWDPHVFVDLHTTDGSFHGYALTYSPSLNPAAPLGDYTRTLLAELRTRVRVRDGFETFDYGNFEDPGGEVSTDTVHSGWYTYDHRPRFGTNYYGLRNRVSVLSEAFSHDPFERRVKATYAFVRELLSLVAERGPELKGQEAALASRGPDSVALRAALPATTTSRPVAFEVLTRTGLPERTQPGVPIGVRRTGEIRTRPMPVFDRFVPTVVRPVPAYYVLSGDDTATLNRLRAHGFRPASARLARFDGGLERFVVDSVVRAGRPFQGHLEARLFGRWVDDPAAHVSDPYLVSAPGGRGRLLSYLLDPESDDGFATWDLFSSRVAAGTYPVRRYLHPPIIRD
jgi:hypothetical protein